MLRAGLLLSKRNLSVRNFFLSGRRNNEESVKQSIKYYSHTQYLIYIFFTIVNNLKLQGLWKRWKLEDVNCCHRKLHLRFDRGPTSICLYHLSAIHNFIYVTFFFFHYMVNYFWTLLAIFQILTDFPIQKHTRGLRCFEWC